MTKAAIYTFPAVRHAAFAEGALNIAALDWPCSARELIDVRADVATTTAETTAPLGVDVALVQLDGPARIEVTPPNNERVADITSPLFSAGDHLFKIGFGWRLSVISAECILPAAAEDIKAAA